MLHPSTFSGRVCRVDRPDGSHFDFDPLGPRLRGKTAVGNVVRLARVRVRSLRNTRQTFPGNSREGFTVKFPGLLEQRRQVLLGEARLPGRLASVPVP